MMGQKFLLGPAVASWRRGIPCLLQDMQNHPLTQSFVCYQTTRILYILVIIFFSVTCSNSTNCPEFVPTIPILGRCKAYAISTTELQLLPKEEDARLENWLLFPNHRNPSIQGREKDTRKEWKKEDININIMISECFYQKQKNGYFVTYFWGWRIPKC